MSATGAGGAFAGGSMGGILKFFGSVIGFIFLIGLIVVVALLMLIF
jgi:hypothetical protein